ncbi:MAG: HD domain-containing protein [bacterium]|nr:HD domain-containing protein [bacterium]
MEEKYNLLIVDDEMDNLALLYRTLRKNYNILKTTSPLEALEMLKTNDIDMILSDHKMEEMDGVKFLAESYKIKPNCVRLLITAYADANILITAINEGKIFRYVKKPWEPSDLEIVMDSACDYLKLKTENNKLLVELKGLFTGTINAIVDSLEAKDHYTLGKSKRVTFCALKLADFYNLPRSEVSKLELAGLLHDIGMIGVPEQIINKTEALTPEEEIKIKKHVEYGIKILEDIKQLKDVVDVIKYHHEKYNGTGYPFGLKGKDIPFNSQIIAIADTFDSLISNRAYRSKITFEEALEKLASDNEEHFSTQLVKDFTETMMKNKEEFIALGI